MVWINGGGPPRCGKRLGVAIVNLDSVGELEVEVEVRRFEGFKI
jgi:hypothetical protein